MRGWLLRQGIDVVPQHNVRLFDEMQAHQLLIPCEDKAIWHCRIEASGGWNTELTLLRFFAPVLLTSASVSCVGSLGFVGLMAPHMARFLLRGGQVALLCGSALVGALLVLATDTIGRLAFAPLQIPAGIVIALVGCPFFIVLLWRRRDAL